LKEKTPLVLIAFT